MAEANRNRRSLEAPEVDLTDYGGWRSEADPENLELIEMYGTLLVNQYQGMGDALSLPSVVAALDLCGVPQSRRRDTARRLVYLHGLVLKTIPKEAPRG